jgi:flagellar protein FlgJ
MDITAIGGGNLRNSGYVPFSAASSSPVQSPDGSERVFSELLEKSASMNREPKEPRESQESPSLGLRKPVIDKNDKLYEQCEALETFLIKTLISSMRSTVQKSELLDPGFAGQMYEDMLYDEYAKDFSKNANFGFAELAYLELTGQRGKLMTQAK